MLRRLRWITMSAFPRPGTAVAPGALASRLPMSRQSLTQLLATPMSRSTDSAGRASAQRLRSYAEGHTPGLSPLSDSMLGGSGGRGRCGMAIGPVTGMLALCALGCSALGLPLLPERGPSVQPCAMKGFNEGFNSSNPADGHRMDWNWSHCTLILQALLNRNALCSQESSMWLMSPIRLSMLSAIQQLPQGAPHCTRPICLRALTGNGQPLLQALQPHPAEMLLETGCWRCWGGRRQRGSEASEGWARSPHARWAEPPGQWAWLTGQAVDFRCPLWRTGLA